MTIFQFTNENHFLSNFHPATFFWNDLQWDNSECAYQAAKSLDIYTQLSFTKMSAREAKKEGKVIACRPDWEQVKVSIMTEIVYEKFSQNPDLIQKLLATGTQKLEEGNNWGDKFWGVSPVGGYGQNWLGRILMSIRKDFQLQEHGIE